jgi:hypothetical protein
VATGFLVQKTTKTRDELTFNPLLSRGWKKIGTTLRIGHWPSVHVKPPIQHHHHLPLQLLPGAKQYDDENNQVRKTVVVIRNSEVL